MFAASWIIPSSWSSQALGAILATGTRTVAILCANNLRDITTDTRVGIRTLTRVLGQKNSTQLYQLELLLAYIFQVRWVAFSGLPATTLITLLAAASS